MFVTTGKTGSFSASILTPGNYFIVLQHGAASTNQIQNVTVNYLLDGSNPTVLGAGIGVLAVGVVMIFIGYRTASRAQPPPKTTDVVMFDRPKPETPPGQNQ